jgi:O-antigen biosynthesis protein
LTGLVFDQYQRYKKTEEVINALRPENTIYKILEVGANEHRNLEKFLPKDNITYLDVKQPVNAGGDVKYIIGDATKMNIEDNSFDIIVALDVYEHIPSDRRQLFFKEINRVADKFFIVCAPFASKEVIAAEESVNTTFKAIYEKDHPWLLEHRENGLPELQPTLDMLKALDINFVSIKQGEICLWEKLMKTQFFLAYQDDSQTAMEDIFKYYNKYQYQFDVGNKNYRDFLICSKHSNMNLDKILEIFTDINVEEKESISKELDSLLLNSVLNESLNGINELKKKTNEIKKKENELKNKETRYIKIIKDKDTHIFNLEKRYHIYLAKKTKDRLIKTGKMSFNIFSKFKVRNIRKGLDYYNKYGLKAVISKLVRNNDLVDYDNWIKLHLPGIKEIEEQKQVSFKYAPKISIAVPTYNTPENYLVDMIESVRTQSYSNWELCIADGNSSEDRVREIVSNYAKLDERIKFTFLKENLGISGNSNESLKIATGDYIGLLDHDDLLTPNALYEVVKLINELNLPEAIYSDEDKIDEHGKTHFEPHFKPDYSPDTLRSYNYITHFFVFKKALLLEVGNFRSEFDGSQDYDLILRITEKANKVGHIPKILYHWRAHRNSAAGNVSAKTYAYVAGRKAIKSHIDRMGLKGQVKDGLFIGSYKVNYDIKDKPKVSIIIPNKDEKSTLEKCIKSIINKSTYTNYEIIIVENNSSSSSIFDYYKELELNKKIKVVYWDKEFNYSAINNFGVKYAAGNYILFLNNDVEVITLDWIEEMLMFCQRDEVGAVGAKLYYPDDTIQHAGAIIGMCGVAGHFHKYFNRIDAGYVGRLKVVQNLSSVTAACMMVKKDLFLSIGGFNEDFKVAFNDIDLCLEIRKRQKLIIMNPYVELYHYESKSRGLDDTEEKINRFNGEIARFEKKWGMWLDDPYYNVNLSKLKEDVTLNLETE